MANMRVRVRVADLIKKVEAARARAVKAHEIAEKKFETASQNRQAQVVSSLERALATAKAGKELKYRYGDLLVEVPEMPSRPSLYLANYDRDLALLKVTTDEALSISTDDRFASYL